jgi:putative sugar O-methyltransferase
MWEGRAMDALLARMQSDLVGADPLFRPTTFWSTCSDEILADIEALGIDSFRRHPSALRYFVPEYPDDAPVKRKIMRLLGRPSRAERSAREHFERLPPASVSPLFAFSESDYGRPAQRLDLGGRRHSRSSLNYLRALAMLHRTVAATDIRSLLEIGGGFGTLGEIFLTAYPDAFYVNVDIPPLAYVSTQYLRAVFGRDAVASYDITADMPVIDLAELRRSFRAVVLCAWQLPRVTGKVDLFCNFISFQEMEPAVVQNYARLVQPLTERFLLMRNAAAGQRTGKAGPLPTVDQPIVAEDYRKWFSDFEVIAADDSYFGDTSSSGWRSEVTVARRVSERT